MGNRAIIVSTGVRTTVTAGIYVHWFNRQALWDAIKEMMSRGYRDPADDAEYGMARLCQVLCEQNPDGLNIGLTTVDIGDPHCADGLDVGLIAVDYSGIFRVAWNDECPYLFEAYSFEEED